MPAIKGPLGNAAGFSLNGQGFAFSVKGPLIRAFAAIGILKGAPGWGTGITYGRDYIYGRGSVESRHQQF